MKTAQEMYQYCIDNGFGEGQNKKWGTKHFSLIEQALGNDEYAIMCFIGLHNYVSMTKHDSNFAYAITNKRIIMAQQKVIGQNFQTVAIDNLNDITMTTGAVFGTIVIDTIKETFNVGVNKIVAKNINNVIHDVLLSLKEDKKASANTNAPTASSADEILKYKNLLDMGAITQDEFDEKKRQLLGL